MEAAGGQVRKVHIVYFLSRSDRVEHPHLFRVHHLRRNGVFLRDVKRWLGDLRGREMPEAFSWSYKRRYKSGYIWQDLRDDDLITPISDNEYVLKGSEILPSTFGFSTHLESQRRSAATMLEEQNGNNETEGGRQVDDDGEAERPPSPRVIAKTSSDSSPLSGSARSTLTDDSIKGENLSSSQLAEAPHCGKETSKKDKGIGHINGQGQGSFSSSASLSSEKSPLMDKRKSGGATQMLRNLLSCGAADTNDKVIVMLNRAGKNRPMDGDRDGGEISRDDGFGGSARTNGTPPAHQPRSSTSSRKSFDGTRGSSSKKKAAEYGGAKFVPAAYRPIGGPTCSQCGKVFKPEKLHTHMKSCKGMKNLVKAAAARPPSPAKFSSTTGSSFLQPNSGYFITN